MTPALRAVLRKEVRQITRDPRLLAMLVVAPALQLLIFGYAVDFEVDHIDTRVCDLDGSAPSRELARGLAADGTFRLRLPPAACSRSGRTSVTRRGFSVCCSRWQARRRRTGRRRAMSGCR